MVRIYLNHVNFLFQLPHQSELFIHNFSGLVASILRRGSQDDLALCVAGNSAVSPKVTASNLHPSAPPRIKRHASVIVPRKGKNL